jgi:hypothetical protein
MKYTKVPQVLAGIAIACIAFLAPSHLIGAEKAEAKKIQAKAAVKPADKSGDGAESKRPGPARIGITVEWIELEHHDLSMLLGKHGDRLDATPLREELQGMIQRKEAELVETQWLSTRSGRRSTVQSAEEQMYPTEYDPPEIPDKLSLSNVNAADYRGTPATPTAWETRLVGPHLEVDASIDADEDAINLNVAPALVRFLRRDYHHREGTREDEITQVYMPVFHSMTVVTEITVKDGAYALLGALTPPEAKDKRMFVIMRADILR